MSSSLCIARGSFAVAQLTSRSRARVLNSINTHRKQVRSMGSGGSSSKELVDDLVQKHPVMVFSKSYCPFCAKAKSTLSGLNSKFEVLEIENRDDMNDIQDYLATITGGRSVPRVFINGKCIGGGDETAALARSGELEKLLKEVGGHVGGPEAAKVGAL